MTYEEMLNTSLEKIDCIIEKRTGKKLKFGDVTGGRVDIRGSVLLNMKRVIDMDKINKREQEILAGL